jgi:hypothetical protein
MGALHTYLTVLAAMLFSATPLFSHELIASKEGADPTEHRDSDR